MHEQREQLQGIKSICIPSAVGESVYEILATNQP